MGENKSILSAIE